MASEPRKIEGPCFDECANGWVSGTDGGYTWCNCRRGTLADTAPTPRIEPEDLRPNVPPRMMS